MLERPEATPMPLVSVGIPTFNRAHMLRRSIDSALAQDYSNIEVIVSDNASRDETSAVCEDLCSADRRLRVIKQTENIGPTRNFIAVRDQARGEFFMWLADDDWMDPQYVSACMRIHLANPETAVVAGRSLGYRAGIPIGYGRSIRLTQSMPIARVLRYYAAVGDNGAFYGVMRRNVLLRCQLPNALGGDWVLMAQMAFLGTIEVDSEVCIHREREGATAESISGIVRSLGLPRIHALFPFTSIALSAAISVLARNSVFSRYDFATRSVVGALVTLIVLVRGGLTYAKMMVIKVLGIERSRKIKRLLRIGIRHQ